MMSSWVSAARAAGQWEGSCVTHGQRTGSQVWKGVYLGLLNVPQTECQWRNRRGPWFTTGQGSGACAHMPRSPGWSNTDREHMREEQLCGCHCGRGVGPYNHNGQRAGRTLSPGHAYRTCKDVEVEVEQQTRSTRMTSCWVSSAGAAGVGMV
jgi:hypothetical protein